jgi:hypothetical protein
VSAKREVLSYLAARGSADSLTVALDLGYETRGGAASTLLRLHRHGHLRRQLEPSGYVYAISRKGERWLEYVAQTGL